MYKHMCMHMHFPWRFEFRALPCRTLYYRSNSSSCRQVTQSPWLASCCATVNRLSRLVSHVRGASPFEIKAQPPPASESNISRTPKNRHLATLILKPSVPPSSTLRFFKPSSGGLIICSKIRQSRREGGVKSLVTLVSRQLNTCLHSHPGTPLAVAISSSTGGSPPFSEIISAEAVAAAESTGTNTRTTATILNGLHLAGVVGR